MRDVIKKISGKPINNPQNATNLSNLMKTACFRDFKDFVLS